MNTGIWNLLTVYRSAFLGASALCEVGLAVITCYDLTARRDVLHAEQASVACHGIIIPSTQSSVAIE